MGYIETGGWSDLEGETLARIVENPSFIIMKPGEGAIPCLCPENFADCGPRLRALP